MVHIFSGNSIHIHREEEKSIVITKIKVKKTYEAYRKKCKLGCKKEMKLV